MTSDGDPTYRAGDSLIVLDGTYVSQIWFLCAPTKRAAGIPDDVLAVVLLNANNRWEMRYRFRFDDGSGRSPFESRDQKQHFAAVAKDGITESQALAASHVLFDSMRERCGFDMHILPVRTSDPETIFAALRREEWAHEHPRHAQEIAL